ncbi:MAG TPA: beta-ketoacyl synthase N-terminal-like domain-containing protein [Thermoanaerobaculia bacterium]|nr:beta-ketoacyl synthase N-terminal-like domain-containing protein [Thermoanaerobaculia bacterium]
MDVTWIACDDPNPERVTIGVPVANTRLHVVDRHMRPQPVGVAGELLIGGVQLARGYLGRPSLTAERFVPDPFADLFAGRGDLAGDGRLYRTGDLARYLPAVDGKPGEIEYLGRLDHQVKIRGLRIELGEIEAALGDHPAVREAVVMALGDGPADLRLVAFLVADEAEASPAALREQLRTRLPEHMVPAAYVHLDEMPVSPNGKADRKELAKRAPRPGLGFETGAAVGAPAGDLERRVAAVWAKVLGHDAFSPQDNFFDVGGHSLLAVQLQRDLRRDLGFEVEVVDLFQYPTVRSLAGFLRQESGEETAVAEIAPRAVASGAVAVVGMAGRFPGAASVDELWDNLRSGVESVRTYTHDEMRAFGVSEELLADPHFVPVGAELEGADLFDAGYFDYSPREADVIDPQQRVFLETAVAALEDAAVDPARYGGRIGVFAGAAENRHVFRIAAHPELVRSVGPYQVMLSNRADYLPTRTAYKLGLTGPAINVQTACSTSLVAVHVACRALLAGECEAALAGGVSVGYLEPRGYRWERGGISSPDGHTRAFDAAGRGTTRGHGVGVVVLKRLEDALADGDPIHGVIRGSATNNDGRLKAGFTAPSVDGQTAVIRAAQRAAGVEAASVGYVEAHGTATELGDPIEFAALSRAFAGSDLEAGAVALGSVKSNLGHLDAASGVTGLIKALLAVREGEIPPSLHFETPNPKLGLEASPFHVATGLEAWPAGDGPRRAGVSSFGVGGTNAHAIVEEPPRAVEEPPAVEAGETAETPGWVCLPLSARTPEALAAAGERLAGWLEAHGELGGSAVADTLLADAAWTLQTGRRELEQRRTVVADGRQAAVEALRTGGGLEARGEAAGMPSVAFLLSGQGAQHLGMARSLHAAFPAFRDAFERCRTLLAGHLDVDLAELVWGSEGGDREAEAARLEDTRHAQPALFAVEYAAAELWRAAGVVPSALLGHSLGEYVAACLAGVFSLDDALALVVARGRAMAACEPGSMLAVARSEAEVERLLSGQTAIELAAVNGPEACVVSGPAPAVEAWAAEMASAGVEVRPLHTSHAFHSAAMEPALDPLRRAFEGVETSPPRIPFLSNRTGSWITADQATDPEYWLGHLRAPVRFAAGAAELLADESRLLVEVGPGRALATLARQQPAARGRTVVQSLAHPRGGEADEARFLAAAGALWCAGAEIDWRPFTGTGRRRLRLPSYPFQRKSHWVAEPRRAAGGTAAADVAEPSVRQRSAAAVAEAPPVGGGDGAPRTPLEAQLAAAWHELLGGDPIGVDDDFFDLGGSSLLAVRLAARLGDRLGVDLDPHDLIDHSTVARLAARLEALHPQLATGGEAPAAAEHAASDESSPDPLLVRLRGDGERTPLFLVHPAGGHALYYRHVVAALDRDRPVWAFRSSGLEAGEEVISGVEKMAERYLEALRRARPHGPYALAGSSFGGSVAWEMARRLSESGETVEALVLVDTFGPGQLPERGAVQAPREADGDAPPHAAEAAAGDADAVDARIDAVTRANVESMYAYEPAPWDGRATFFRATLRSGPGEPTHPERAWIEVARGGLEVQLLPGGHIGMHSPPHAATLAARLDDVLRRAISSPACPAFAVGAH